MKIFKRIKWSYVVLSAMFLLLGIFLVANPETSLIMICRILGAAMAVFGVMKIVLYFIREVEGVAIRFDFAIGLFCVVLGALMLWRAPALTDVLSVMIGLLVLVDSVFKLQVAVDSRRMGAHSWWVTLVCTVVCLVLGILGTFMRGSWIPALMCAVVLGMLYASGRRFYRHSLFMEEHIPAPWLLCAIGLLLLNFALGFALYHTVWGQNALLSFQGPFNAAWSRALNICIIAIICTFLPLEAASGILPARK